MRRDRALFPLIMLLTSLVGTSIQGEASARGEVAQDPIVGRSASYRLSPAVRHQSATQPGPSRSVSAPSRRNPLAGDATGGWRLTWQREDVPVDGLIRQPNTRAKPPLDLRFPGVQNPFACGGCSPPDPNGDVGPLHYIQMVNATKVAVFDKAGHLLTKPFDLGDLWGGGNCAEDAGDPIVLYDEMANRWLLSQFAFPNHMCVAISRRGDPLGRYHLYRFDVGNFPDYFKFGVWPDAYYMGANESSYTAYAFDRAKMLAGDPTAGFVKFRGQTNFLLPADVDGSTPPPLGTPGFFYTFKDNSFHGGRDRIELFALHVDWVHPALSTIALEDSFRLTPFTYTVCGFFNFDCARQRGTTQRIDVVSEWPMHRFPYRNFGNHQTLLGNFTIGGGLGRVGAAIRWFELRNNGTGWRLRQEGTYDPGDGNDRFMGSIAMDGAGNIALGYTVSSPDLYPSIRYATRTAADPPGTLGTEAVLRDGGGAQTGSNRWGDYSAMAVDPANDCSFWYTNEHYTSDSASNWKTTVGVFTMPNC